MAQEKKQEKTKTVKSKNKNLLEMVKASPQAPGTGVVVYGRR